MAIELPPDFSEFLRSLTSRGVRYLVVGGYAVAWHGYPRSTQDLDVWIGIDPVNAAATAEAIREFGFDTPNLGAALFLERGRVVRMGYPPIRIEVLTSVSGIEFEDAWGRRIEAELGSVTVPLINLEDLKTNKRAAGRHKDLDDLEHLP
jgi:predicted nucleotidyltransferase